MSETPAPNTVLSREELGALLDTMAESVRHEQARQSTRAIGVAPLVGNRSSLQRLAQTFAAEQGRSLSTMYQTPIGMRFSHWEEISLSDFASAMLEEDRVARFHLGGDHPEAVLLVSRPLVFGLMMLAFGAKSGSDPGPIPERAYTRIEERFLARAATDLATTLAKSLANVSAEDVRLLSLDPPAALLDQGPRPQLVASFDVRGVGDLCKLRIALPASVVESGPSELPPGPIEPSTGLERELLDVPVQVRVAIGDARLSVSDVAALAVGSEIALEPLAGGQLVVSVGEKEKFRAERGVVDQRLAVRILEAV